MPELKVPRWVHLKDSSSFEKIGSSRDTDSDLYPPVISSPSIVQFDYDNVQLPGHITYDAYAIPVLRQNSAGDPTVVGVHVRTTIDFCIINELSFNSWLDKWFESSMQQVYDATGGAEVLNFYDIENEKGKRASLFEYEFQKQRKLIESRLGVNVDANFSEASGRKVIENFVPGAFIVDHNLLEPLYNLDGTENNTFWDVTDLGLVSERSSFEVKSEDLGVLSPVVTQVGNLTLTANAAYYLEFKLSNSFTGGLNISLGGNLKKGYAVGLIADTSGGADAELFGSRIIDDFYGGSYIADTVAAEAAAPFTVGANQQLSSHEFDRVFSSSNFYTIPIVNSGSTSGKLEFSPAVGYEHTGVDKNGNPLPNPVTLVPRDSISLEISHIALLPEGAARYTIEYS